MLLAKIDPQTTVEQVSANRLVVVHDGRVIRQMDCIITNDRIDELTRWARGEEVDADELFVYELTDGQEVTATRLMTLEQAVEANEKASQYSDGNWHWQPNPNLS